MDENLKDPNTEEQELKRKAEAARRELISWIKMVVLAVAIAFLLRTFVFQLAYVKGPSMQPTLFEGQILIISKIGYLTGNPEQGQIVVLNDYLENKELIKRVIGLPGEKIEVKDDKVYINDKPLDPDYTDSPTGNFDFQSPQKVPQSHYFVLGDNRTESRDSRSNTVGFVDRKAIKGRAVFRLWPFDRFGTLD